MGFSGLVATSQNPSVVPDLAFFSLLLKDQAIFLSMIITILKFHYSEQYRYTGKCYSSLIIVDGNKVIKFSNYLKLSKQIIIFLSLIYFLLHQKDYILYLFLLADLFCCAAVLSVFCGFYSKSFNEKMHMFQL